VDQQRMIDQFLQLIAIDSPGRAEREVAAVLEAMLRDLGLEPHYDDAGAAIGGDCGNLIARLPATAPGLPSLLLCAHMDTVSPSQAIRPVFDGEIIRSCGDTILGADDKAGIVVILEVLRALAGDDRPRGEVIAAFTVAEEIGLLGAGELDIAALGAHAAFVLDGGRTPGSMAVGAPYADRMVYTIRGEAAHAGCNPQQGISSIMAASRGIANMRVGRIDDETTANVGIIHGGRATNIVPPLTTVHAEARSHDEAKLVAQAAHMAQSMTEGARSVGAELEIDHTRSYDGFLVSDDAPVVQWASAAARELGYAPCGERGGGGSDANVFNARGLPAIIVSTGAADAHSLTESLSIPDMVAGARWLLQSILVANRR
jgi:tripeptide aminopeptidase